MYINFEYLNKQELDYTDFIILVAVNQKDLSSFIHHCDESFDEGLKCLGEKGYIERLKSKEGYKLTKQGRKILREVEVANISDEVNSLLVRLQDAYIASNRKGKLGNQKNALKFLANFVAETDFDSDLIVAAVEQYLDDTPEMYTSMLEKLIFKPANHYSSKFKLSESKLYTIVKEYHANN
jgi:DNA-binding MarR family transcriptional regulator